MSIPREVTQAVVSAPLLPHRVPSPLSTLIVWQPRHRPAEHQLCRPQSRQCRAMEPATPTLIRCETPRGSWCGRLWTRLGMLKS